MTKALPPTVSFELGIGEFRIVTPQAVYQIRVRADLVEAMAGVAETLSEPGVSPGQQIDNSFFKDISEELFAKVGQLAKSLAVSVTDLPGGSTVGQDDLTKTGEELESAKGQLEEVVAITEKASMTIMDVADQIQDDMDQLKSQMEALNTLDLTVQAVSAEGVGASDEALVSPRQFEEKWTKLKELLADLGVHPASAPTVTPAPAVTDAPLDQAAVEALLAGDAPAPAATDAPLDQAAVEALLAGGGASVDLAPTEEAASSAGRTTFDLDVVFQTLYELCTNESVKDHIKVMREQKDSAFNSEDIVQKLSDLSATVDNDDGFYNFPIPDILKTLYAATSSEEYKTTLKKMNQTAASIFLDSVLPVEGTVEEAAVQSAAPAPLEEAPPVEAAAGEVLSETPPPAAAGESNGEQSLDLSSLNVLVAELDQMLPKLSGTGGSDGAYTSILTQDRNTIVNTINLSNDLVKRTTNHLNSIIEALSFQDLSGQRIKKIVSLLGDVQVQLLSLLVSVNSKIKAYKDDSLKEKPAVETDKMAQEEVDRMLEKVAGTSAPMLGPGAENRLDQGAVNDLLAQMGF